MPPFEISGGSEFEDWCILLDLVRTSFTIIDRMLVNLVRKHKEKSGKRTIRKLKRKNILSLSKHIIEDVLLREEEFEIIPRGEFKNIFKKKKVVELGETSEIPETASEIFNDLFQPLA